MSGHLAESILCPHCGERLTIQERQNSDGDVVKRGTCPLLKPDDYVGCDPWATAWMLELRAPSVGG